MLTENALSLCSAVDFGGAPLLVLHLIIVSVGVQSQRNFWNGGILASVPMLMDSFQGRDQTNAANGGLVSLESSRRPSTMTSGV